MTDIEQASFSQGILGETSSRTNPSFQLSPTKELTLAKLKDQMIELTDELIVLELRNDSGRVKRMERPAKLVRQRTVDSVSVQTTVQQEDEVFLSFSFFSRWLAYFPFLKLVIREALMPRVWSLRSNDVAPLNRV